MIKSIIEIFFYIIILIIVLLFILLPKITHLSRFHRKINNHIQKKGKLADYAVTFGITFLSIFVAVRVNNLVQNITDYYSYKKQLNYCVYEINHTIISLDKLRYSKEIGKGFLAVNMPMYPEYFENFVLNNSKIVDYLDFDNINEIMGSLDNLKLLYREYTDPQFNIGQTNQTSRDFARTEIMKMDNMMLACFDSFMSCVCIYYDKKILDIKNSKAELYNLMKLFQRDNKNIVINMDYVLLWFNSVHN